LVTKALLGRPIVVGGLRFYRDSSSVYISSIFFHQPYELAKRNLPKTGHMFESECYLKMYVKSRVSPPSKNQGPQNHFFDDFAT